jgi:hypothetical protein
LSRQNQRPGSLPRRREASFDDELIQTSTQFPQP